MTGSDPQDHWKSIADLLGTTPSAEPEPPRAATPRPVPSERPKKEKEAKPAPPKRKTHWGSVLNEVGLAAQPDEAHDEPPAAFTPPETTAKAPIEEAFPVDSIPPAAWSDTGFDAGGDMFENDPLVMPTESVFDEVASPILTDDVEMAELGQEDSETQATSGDSDEPRRRRRRRRRGRRRREEGAEAESLEESTSSPPTPRMDIVADAVTDIGEGDEADWTIDDTSQPTTDAESEERPRRRRRRRRGRRDREEGGSETPATSEAADTSSDEDEPDVELHDDHDDSEDTGEGTSDLPTHRKIPTWREAIGVLVEANLSNHTKTKPFRSGGGGGRRRPN